jgi:uncharacterized protein YbaR (Trm112 family)
VKVLLVILVCPVTLVFQGLPVLKGRKVSQDYLACPVTLVFQGLPVLKGRKVLADKTRFRQKQA